MTFMTFPRSFYSISTQSHAAFSHPTHRSKAYPLPTSFKTSPPPYINQSASVFVVRLSALRVYHSPPAPHALRTLRTHPPPIPPATTPKAVHRKHTPPFFLRCGYIINSRGSPFVHILTRNSHPPSSPHHHLPITPSFRGHPLHASFRLATANPPLTRPSLLWLYGHQTKCTIVLFPPLLPHPRVQVLFFIIHTCAYYHSFLAPDLFPSPPPLHTLPPHTSSTRL